MRPPSTSGSVAEAPTISLESLSPPNSTTPLTLHRDPAKWYNRWWNATITWICGPTPPREVAFKPFFPQWQAWPAETVDRLLKTRRKKLCALVAFYIVWMVLFVTVVHYSWFADEVEGVKPVHLSCTSTFWGKNNACGLDGLGCAPFTNSSLLFRCPSNCIDSGQVLSARAVGAEVVNFSTFVIGGPGNETLPSTVGVYRADSFICPAAIHAGVISNKFGGCGILSKTGRQRYFPRSRAHGITSIPFDTFFPSSYTFQTAVRSSSCKDLRWHLFAVSIPFTTALSLLCTHPATTFYTLFTALFFHVSFGSDPPALTHPPALASRALSRFLPAAFAAFFLWTLILRPIHSTRLLTHRAAVERTILFLGGLWVGTLSNITLEAAIPINRLTGLDLAVQPGAKAALAIICIVLLFIVLGQIWFLRLAGRLPRFLALYAALGITLGLLAAIPGNSLRIHHYILALLLLPGTKLLTRPSLLYQGLLLGLFINGVARWGFAGIVETREEIVGDGIAYTPLPRLLPPEVRGGEVTLRWNATGADGWEGVSVLVDDVERVRWRMRGEGLGEATVERGDGKMYVRVGYYDFAGVGGDYTRAGVLGVEGEWEEPEKGWT